MTDRQRLMSAARRLLASHEDAEDAVQDTYVRALATFPNCLEPGQAWLHTLVLDGVVLCIVPVGVQATSVGELA